MSFKGVPPDERIGNSPARSLPVTLPVDGATSGHADYTAPTGVFIRGVNISVAGVLKMQGIDGTSGFEQFNTGWNPCTLSTKILDSSSNTATVLRVATTEVSVTV